MISGSVLLLTCEVTFSDQPSQPPYSGVMVISGYFLFHRSIALRVASCLSSPPHHEKRRLHLSSFPSGLVTESFFFSEQAESDMMQQAAAIFKKCFFHTLRSLINDITVIIHHLRRKINRKVVNSDKIKRAEYYPPM